MHPAAKITRWTARPAMPYIETTSFGGQKYAAGFAIAAHQEVWQPVRADVRPRDNGTLEQPHRDEQRRHPFRIARRESPPGDDRLSEFLQRRERPHHFSRNLNTVFASIERRQSDEGDSVAVLCRLARAADGRARAGGRHRSATSARPARWSGCSSNICFPPIASSIATCCGTRRTPSCGGHCFSAGRSRRSWPKAGRGTKPSGSSPAPSTRSTTIIGYRPVAVLESQQIEPYAHERVRPIPLYIQGVGVAHGPYEELIARALAILAETRSGDPARRPGSIRRCWTSWRSTRGPTSSTIRPANGRTTTSASGTRNWSTIAATIAASCCSRSRSTRCCRASRSGRAVPARATPQTS